MNKKSLRRVIWLLIPAILALTSACIVTEYFQDLVATPTSVPSTPTITGTLTSTSTPTDTPVPPTITLTTTSTPVPTITPTITQTATQELPHARYPQTPVPVQLPLPYVEGQWRITVGWCG